MAAGSRDFCSRLLGAKTDWKQFGLELGEINVKFQTWNFRHPAALQSLSINWGKSSGPSPSDVCKLIMLTVVQNQVIKWGVSCSFTRENLENYNNLQTFRTQPQKTTEPYLAEHKDKWATAANCSGSCQITAPLPLLDNWVPHKKSAHHFCLPMNLITEAHRLWRYPRTLGPAKPVHETAAATSLRHCSRFAGRQNRLTGAVMSNKAGERWDCFPQLDPSALPRQKAHQPALENCESKHFLFCIDKNHNIKIHQQLYLTVLGTSYWGTDWGTTHSFLHSHHQEEPVRTIK